MRIRKYKRVLCRVFPQRSEELDCYLANIMQIETSYGEHFYDYHKLFSAKAATALREFKVQIDWGVTYNDLLTLLAPHARPDVCKICHAIDHATNFCPLFSMNQDCLDLSRRKVQYSDRTDRRGRTRIAHDGKEVCNNYNSLRGCVRSACSFAHTCNSCFLNHTVFNCNKTSSSAHQKNNSGKRMSTVSEEKK